MLLHLISRFLKGDKNVKTFSKGEQILLLLRKFYGKIGRKLIISYPHKMQPLLMLQKRNRLAIPGGSLKKPEPSKNTQKQVKSSSRS